MEENELWWHGPSWLLNEEEASINDAFETNLEVRKKNKVAMNAIIVENFVDKFSSLKKAIDIVAYCFKFYAKIKAKINEKKNKEKIEVNNGASLNMNELRKSKTSIIKMYQNQWYSKEITALSNKLVIDKNSSLKSLCPFLDENGLLRVGGKSSPNQQIPISTTTKNFRS